MNLQLESLTIQGWPFNLLGIAYGRGRRLQLEVICSDHDRKPNSGQLRSAWKARQAGRGVPLLVIVRHAGKIYVCGPSGEDPAVHVNLDPGQVERICKEALDQPNRQAALRALRDSLGVLEEQGLPGLRNEGFLATHELINGVPNRSDWFQVKDRDRKILDNQGRNLLELLGFSVEPLDNVTEILKCGDRKNAVGVLLSENETPESGSERIPGNLSPVSYALARAEEQNLDWVVVIHGWKIRLYPVKMGVGIGRKGRTETFLECHTGLLPDDKAAYLWLLFSADALSPDGSLTSILADSMDFAGDLARRLRERIYDEVVPRLAEGLADARGIENPTAQDLSETYSMAMHVLFRLLFIAYGEDKGLLPYRFNGLYQKRSLNTKAKDLLELLDSKDSFGDDDTWWQEVRAIFHAVDKGNKAWGVPAYNGGLFSQDSKESFIGAILEGVSLPDRVFGPVLQNLLLVPTAEGVMGPVDFRSLGVREFGTIYEGLLESELSVAETDLMIETTGKGKIKDTYRPCNEGEAPIIPRGKIYLHNSSGARKSTGSYYTKHFVVEHLLDCSLEPAIDDHFTRLDELGDLEAAEAFFDFRVADISMGSGHFLVATIDRIEARFSHYLSMRAKDGHPLTVVTQELGRLRSAARAALGDAADFYPDFEDNTLLRRQIARRCIYGVDTNEVAVQLARLAIWLHTFVPGLPLSLLDRNLIQGNSLVGVGHLSELEDKIREDSEGSSLFETSAAAFVGDASEALSKLGRIADATFSEIQQAREVWASADAAIRPAKALCDILTAARIDSVALPFDFTRWEETKGQVFGGVDHLDALKVLQGMHALHFPIAFPEVFLRERAGFDVILGNPPWEKAHVESHEFWARHSPGLRGMDQSERERQYAELSAARPDLQRALDAEVKATNGLRQILTSGPYPGMGSGHPDLYKAFCWRFWFLAAREKGRVSVVLPRMVLASKGSEEFRWEIFRKATYVNATILYNKSFWLFDMDNRKAIVLLDLQRGYGADTGVSFQGPFTSRAEFDRHAQVAGLSFSGEDVLSWSEPATVPLLQTSKDAEVFLQLRKAPRLDLDDPMQWRAAPIQGDFNATIDKALMDFSPEPSVDFWPVYKGASFNLWEPKTEEAYACAEPSPLISLLQEKRMRGHRNSNSVFHECAPDWCADPSTLPCRSPRIVFRDATNRTNHRTMICALIPSGVFLTHKAPYFVFPRGSNSDEAYLLGVLSSIPLDWYARRFVETSMAFFVVNPFPIPRPTLDNPLRRRLVELAGRLACTDERFAGWARDVGVEYGALDENEKQNKLYELDAIVAHLYGLSFDHLTHIFETFHSGWKVDDRLQETLNHYRAWEQQI
jgi:hypothetical protein